MGNLQFPKLQKDKVQFLVRAILLLVEMVKPYSIWYGHQTEWTLGINPEIS